MKDLGHHPQYIQKKVLQSVRKELNHNVLNNTSFYTNNHSSDRKNPNKIDSQPKG